MLFRSSTVVSVIFLLLLGFVIAAYNGPANGLVITISDKRVRGLSVALVKFGANIVGFGLGPVFIGGISEALGGGVALRWGMVPALVFYLWGCLHFVMAARSLNRQPKAATDRKSVRFDIVCAIRVVYDCSLL